MTGIIKRIYNAFKLKNATGSIINPSTEDKQDDVITHLATIAGDTTAIDGKVSTESKQDDVITNQTDGTQKSQIVDSGDAAEEVDIEALTDEDTNIDGKSSIVSAALLFARASASVVKSCVMDVTTHALVSIIQEHHEIHQGNDFSCVDNVDLAINNVRDIQITTPDTTKWAHFTIGISVESETEWFFYRNVTINTPGSTTTCNNSNHNSGNTQGLVINYIDNTSVANANSDTAVAGATTIYHGIMGAGKDSGEHDHGHEVILKQNEDYSLRFIANAAGYINYHLDWYEHTDKD